MTSSVGETTATDMVISGDSQLVAAWHGEVLPKRWSGVECRGSVQVCFTILTNSPTVDLDWSVTDELYCDLLIAL